MTADTAMISQPSRKVDRRYGLEWDDVLPALEGRRYPTYPVSRLSVAGISTNAFEITTLSVVI